MARRVIVLGFDGLDPRLCRRFMDAGLLPNFSRLAAQGTFRDLNTSVPCQSPVAWRTLITGTNPGVHGVYDFLRRKPGTYLPEPATAERVDQPLFAEDWQRVALALGAGALGAGAVGAALTALGRLRERPVSRRGFLAACLGAGVAAAAGGGLASSWVPRRVPHAANRCGGEPFWGHLGRNGARTTALRVPVEFPARAYPNSRVLSGLGVPDVRATNGTYTLFATDAVPDATEMGGRIVSLRFEDGRARLELHGPPDPRGPDGKPMAIAIMARRDGDALELAWPGGRCRLRPGEWSEDATFVFSSGPLVSVRGRGRFHLAGLEPETRVYAPPVQFDPSALPGNVALSAPAGYAAALAERYGPYPTLGWPTDTWALTEGNIPDEVYLDDYRRTFARERDVTLGELERNDWDCFFAVFTPTDQVQHLFRPETERGEPAVRRTYTDADDVLGAVSRRFGDDPSTTILAVSDHGFHPFDRAANINTWLWRNGYLRFENPEGPEAPPDMRMQNLYAQSLFWQGIDWENTYAYSMGLGNVYVNLEGREPRGMVRPGEMAEAVRGKLREGLASWQDADGSPVVRTLYYGADTYTGERAGDAADLVVGFHPGYRVSWQTALGGTPSELIEPNDKPWGNDHCSLDPAVTPGVLFCNRPLAYRPAMAEHVRAVGGGAWPSVMDIAPTVCHALGMAPSAAMEGGTLL